jgi:hypothetical protein
VFVVRQEKAMLRWISTSSGMGIQFTMQQQCGHGSNVADESWDMSASDIRISNLMFALFFPRVYVESVPINEAV